MAQPQGQPQSRPLMRVQVSAADKCGLAALITGGISIFMLGLWPLSVTGALAAIILGLCGLRGRNRGFAIAGIVLGAAIFLFYAVLLIIFTLLITRGGPEWRGI